jgi:hypothetical protein
MHGLVKADVVAGNVGLQGKREVLLRLLGTQGRLPQRFVSLLLS